MKKLFRHWMTCDLYYVPEDVISSVVEQVNKYLDYHAVDILGDNLVNTLEAVETREQNDKLYFLGKEEYVICEIDMKNIQFEYDYQKKELINSIFSFIIYKTILEYNKYCIEQLNPDYIKLVEDYK